MFEFRVDNGSGAWALLEVNARPWGSLPLPVALGADFPYRWYRLLVEGDRNPCTPIQSWRLRPQLHPRRPATICARQVHTRPFKTGRLRDQDLAEYMRSFAGREVYDILVRGRSATRLE